MKHDIHLTQDDFDIISGQGRHVQGLGFRV